MDAHIARTPEGGAAGPGDKFPYQRFNYESFYSLVPPNGAYRKVITSLRIAPSSVRTTMTTCFERDTQLESRITIVVNLSPCACVPNQTPFLLGGGPQSYCVS